MFTTINIVTLLMVSITTLTAFSVIDTYAQTEDQDLETIQSYISQAQNELVAGNETAASNQLSLAISEISDVLATLPHTHTHTHEVTHSHPHKSGHHHDEDYTKKHGIYDPKKCPPGLVC